MFQLGVTRAKRLTSSILPHLGAYSSNDIVNCKALRAVTPPLAMERSETSPFASMARLKFIADTRLPFGERGRDSTTVKIFPNAPPIAAERVSTPTSTTLVCNFSSDELGRAPLNTTASVALSSTFTLMLPLIFHPLITVAIQAEWKMKCQLIPTRSCPAVCWYNRTPPD